MDVLSGIGKSNHGLRTNKGLNMMTQRAVRDSHQTDDNADVRCDCGQLVARWVGGDIQIKCKRCRRLVRIAVPRSRSSPSGKS